MYKLLPYNIETTAEQIQHNCTIHLRTVSYCTVFMKLII